MITRQPPPSRPLGRALVAIGCLLLVLGPSGAAGAHTELLQGSPGPTQRTGGTVDFVDLIFVESVSDADIRLEDPNGDPIQGSMVVSDGQIIRYEMPALTITGRYIVRYSMISADGDDTESAYFFTYEPAATQPIRLGQVDVPTEASNLPAIIAAVVFTACVIGLVLILLTKIERGRVAKVEESSGL